ncbi:MLP-like protein 423 [Salvia miltiorrhiza]|uniref:MLP-like protein 423 n=1 Tax=Salvia miltiorrhiza TaxID=226208 RepID=UPI0025AD27CF|nr:MLP-like protein 423 [Salvia miltiorrhiza]
MASKIEMEVELKSDAEKVWKGMRESTILFPKALPQHYQSIEILEGDGKSVNSVRLVNYPQGISAVSSIKEKIEAVDEEKKFVRYSVIDGDILKYYKNFKGSLSVSGKPDNSGTSLKWACEFDKASEDTPDPDFIKDFALKTFQDLDAYILAN